MLRDHFHYYRKRSSGRRVFSIWGASGVVVCLFLGNGRELSGQIISTVREAEFRSRWTDYQVDRARNANTEASDPSDPAAPPTFLGLNRLTRLGPIDLHGGLTTGWEYSDEKYLVTEERETSKSSFFLAPSLEASYKKELGTWNLAARYSVGYLYYLDPNFSGSNGDGTTSQTASLYVNRQSERLAVNSTTSASSGTGFDIERGQATQRIAFRESVSAEYQLAEYRRTGVSADWSYSKNDTVDSSQTGLDSDDYSYSGAAFLDEFYTDKTAFRFELSAGGTTQQTGGDSSNNNNDRTYVQGLFRVNYSPTAKLALTGSIGLGVRNESQNTSDNSQDGLRAIYSLTTTYTPTDKTSVRLYIGLEGAAAEPEFTLAVSWHPREFTFVELSAYRQTGLSNFTTSDERITTGFLASVRQRFFSRLDTSLSGGYEKSTALLDNLGGNPEDPYYFLALGLGWQFNQNLNLQTQYRTSSGRNRFANQNDGLETRSSISLSLTF